jgi:uncharacterized membrane protein YjgN (DUF898 family)
MTFIELPGAVPSSGIPTISASPPPVRTTRFTGDGRAYLRLLARGAVLLAFTLGIYRFWFATDVRRFLWVNTEIDGDSLEYTGTPFELLLGFLVGIAILVPIYVGFFVAALSFGEIGQFIGVIAFPLLALLGQFAIYRARRYRLTRTIYRGIRFHQGGSAVRYAFCAVFWWVLIALTIGLAYPFAQANLERYKMKNTYYGSLRGRFDGSGWRLFVRGIPMWFLVIGPLVLAIVVPITAIDWSKLADFNSSNAEQFFRDFARTNPGIYRAFAAAIGGVFLSGMFATVLYPVLQAVVYRWWIDGLRIGAVTISSELTVGTIFYSYVRFIGWSILFGLVASIVAGIATVLLVLLGSTLAQKETGEILGVIGGVVFYVIIMLGYSTIYQATVKLTLWRHSIVSATVKNPAALNEAKAEGAPSSALGEGLADALNVGGI